MPDQPSPRERRKTPREEARAFFSGLMFHFPGYAYITDRQHRFVYINREVSADASLVLPEHWAGFTTTELFGPEIGSRHEAWEQRVLDSGEAATEVLEYRFRDGSQHYFLLTLFPIRLPDGEQLVGGLATDITAQKLLEKELSDARFRAEHATAIKSAFLANMSHEIRTPLNGILGMLELLETDRLPSESRHELQIIHESADALLTIVNDILDFSKIEAGKLSLEDSDFNPRDVLESVVAVFRGRARQKGLSISMDMPDDLPLLHGDSGRLRQILLNLVSNAVKFTESGNVSLQAEVVQAQPERMLLCVRVSDTGPGITPEALRQLFVPFSQLEAGANRHHGGAGLGLAISRQLADLMGGEISVESHAGHGSVFQLQLHFRAARPQTPAPAALAVPAAGRTLQVLVVDDNPTNLIVAGKTLERLGHHVHAAASGEQALALLAAQHVDLVFMDCHMPGLDGFETTRQVRLQERIGEWPRHVIVAMTASAMAEEEAQCYAAGMDDFLAKPFRLQALNHLIERWAARLPEPSPRVSSAG